MFALRCQRRLFGLGFIFAWLVILAGALGPTSAHARFLQPDTWNPWLAGVDTNRYAYCNNDPINCSDPAGHDFFGVTPENFNGWSGLADAQRRELDANSHPGLNAAREEFAKAALGFTPVGSYFDAKAATEAWNAGRNGAAVGNGAMAVAGLVPAWRVGVKTGRGLIRISWAALRMIGYERHHIISQSLRNHSLLSKIGYDIEASYNTVALPSKLGMTASRTIHRGKHASAYDQRFRQIMDRIEQQLDDGEITRDEALSQLRAEVASMRQNLRNGDVSLNSKGTSNGNGAGSSGSNGASDEHTKP
ncbi:hypothetical protein BH10PSE7_BH10PSE7_40180 [soil metagenome]